MIADDDTPTVTERLDRAAADLARAEDGPTRCSNAARSGFATHSRPCGERSSVRLR